jgi:hypothetical protein
MRTIQWVVLDLLRQSRGAYRFEKSWRSDQLTTSPSEGNALYVFRLE